MKYTKDQRQDIGRRIYEGGISRFDAAEEYGIGADTARNYMRLYRAEHHLPVRHAAYISLPGPERLKEMLAQLHNRDKKEQDDTSNL